MAEHGFTPGPWQVDDAGDIVSGPYNVCIPYATKPEDKQLMAASPTLLEAVQNLLGLFDNPVYRMRLKDDALYPEVIQHARAAITLATGKDA